MEIVFLGTGTSHGMPVIGCRCPACASEDPRDGRWRSSVLVKGRSGERLLVDAGPEFRLQALRAGIDRLDAVLLTHAHADHVHGLDDVRPLCRDRPLEVRGNRQALDEVRERFSYAFRPTQEGGGKPRLDLVPAEGPFRVGGIQVTPLPAFHGELGVLGWLFEEDGRKLAYLTDVSAIPEETAEAAADADLLVLGALRARPHPTHFTFSQAFDAARRLRCRALLATHLCHEHTHEEARSFLGAAPFPSAPAFDGLAVEVDGDAARRVAEL